MVEIPIAGPNEVTVNVFVSYAREDSRWLDPNSRHNLVPFLVESLRRHKVVFWFDHELKPGDEFRRQIKTKIDQSQIALLIVSQNFLNSAFIEGEEMPRISERAAQGQTIVVPVLVEPCDWSDYPFLADRQMVPSSPLIDYTESESSWAKVRYQILDGIKAQVKRIREAADQPVFRKLETMFPDRPPTDPSGARKTAGGQTAGGQSAGGVSDREQQIANWEKQKSTWEQQKANQGESQGSSQGGSSTGGSGSTGGGSTSGGSTSGGGGTLGLGGATGGATGGSTGGLSGGITGGTTGGLGEQRKQTPASYKIVTLTRQQKAVANLFFAGVMVAFLLVAIIIRVHSSSDISDSSDSSSIGDLSSTSNPWDDSAALADTMQFLQEKLNDNRLNFTAYSRNTSDDTTFSTTYVELTSNVNADASQCRIAYHWAEWMNNAAQPDPDVDAAINLKDVDTITVESMRQNITDVNADAGKSYLEVTSTDPDLTTILVHRPQNLVNELAFTDSTLGNDVAKALNHAVSLCGGSATLKD